MELTVSHLRQVIENTPAEVAIFDKEMNYLVVSRRWTDTYCGGIDVVGRNHYAVIPDMPQRWKDVHARVLVGVGERCEEDRFDRADGSVTWMKWEAQPWRDDSGAIAGIIIYSENITDRKKAELALRASEAELHVVTDSMDAIVSRCGRDMRYKWVSSALANWFDLSPDEIVGRPIADVIGQRAFEALKPRFDQVLTGKNVDFEEMIEYLNGPRFVRASYRPIRNSSGSIDGWVASVTDMTSQKQTEDTLRDVSENLKRADERKDEFLAMLGHELRNPIAPIMLAVGLMKRLEAKHPEIAKICGVIERATEQLTRLVDDLLEVSRITRGKITLKKERTTVANVVNRALEISRPVIESKKHQLTVVFPSEPIEVDADVVRLAQVLTNVLNNAAKFTDAGGQIQFAVTRESDFAVFRVRDNGIGIEPNMIEQVFNLFVQADQSLNRPRGGLGLGLHLARRLAEKHGGSIEGKSEGLGKGSEFAVRVPVATGKAPERTTPVPAEHPEKAEIAKRILVVDDSHDIADTIAEVISEAGHETRIAYDGPAALEAAREFKPEIVFLDIGLPGLDGYEVARRMRKTPELKDATLCALTGYGQEEDKRRSREAGFDRHFVKPIDINVISNFIREQKRS